MYAHYVFLNKPFTRKKIISKVSYNLNMRQMFSNHRTTIYENESMRLCIDKKITRVLVYDKNNKVLINTIERMLEGDLYD